MWVWLVVHCLMFSCSDWTNCNDQPGQMICYLYETGLGDECVREFSGKFRVSSHSVCTRELIQSESTTRVCRERDFHRKSASGRQLFLRDQFISIVPSIFWKSSNLIKRLAERDDMIRMTKVLFHVNFRVSCEKTFLLILVVVEGNTLEMDLMVVLGKDLGSIVEKEINWRDSLFQFWNQINWRSILDDLIEPGLLSQLHL